MGDQPMEDVGPQDPSKTNSPIENTPEGEGPQAPSSVDTECYWNGQGYSVGAIICSAGTRLVCQWSGVWSPNGSC
ncbi:MAG: hypothetical protein JWM91_1017 [Rhodospirillales bacterium]|nr:hypothetical protein [Rhodospirillales bacterium]